jgi:hypothetical protein
MLGQMQEMIGTISKDIEHVKNTSTYIESNVDVVKSDLKASWKR